MNLSRVVKKSIVYRLKIPLLYMGMNNLPNFLIIGSQKAGTVALLRYLCQHPQIIGRDKEIRFFSTKNYNKGINWYKKQLPIRLKKDTLVFEKTPEYFFDPKTPERIYRFNKNIKMILLVRDPVKRAYSSWNHYRKYYYSERGFKKERLIKIIKNEYDICEMKDMLEFLNKTTYPSFKQSIEEEIELINKKIFRYAPSFVRQGIYYEPLKRYLKYFEKSQLLVLESKELKSEKKETLTKITKFLKILPFDFSDIQLNDYHKSDYKGDSISNEMIIKLKNFYQPYNEKFFDIIGKRYNW